MQIDIQEAKPIKASYKGQEFNVVQPRVMFLREFQKRMKLSRSTDATEDTIDILIEFCEKVGVPKEVLEQWSMTELTQFFNGMSEGEKKS